MDLLDCRRIVIYGGSFDPPHVAHVALPLLAMEAIGADAVAYIPTALAPHKRDRVQTPAHHRLAMLRLAVAHDPRCFVLTDEIDRATDGRPSYTVDTLAALHERLGATVQMRLLIGTDMARIFSAWREPARAIELAEPLVMIRPPDDREGLLSSLPAGERPAWERRIVDLPRVDVSSTDLRRRVAAGQSIDGLAPGVVRDYVRREGLYR